MGLKANVVNATFDTIIPGLAAGKYDMGASSFTDTKARQKVVDFVDYFSAGTSFFTKATGGTSVTGLADICGKTVSVESGTTEETDASGQSKKCKTAGKPGVNVLVFPTRPPPTWRVSSGRAQLWMADTPVAGLPGQAVTRHVQAGRPDLRRRRRTGWRSRRRAGLAPAVLAALKELMSNGTYTSILSKWGIQSGAMPASQVKINGATS